MDKVDNKSELFKLLFVRQRGILDAPLPAAVSFPIIAIRNARPYMAKTDVISSEMKWNFDGTANPCRGRVSRPETWRRRICPD